MAAAVQAAPAALGHADPTVCDPEEMARIQAHYGVSLKDTPPEALRFIVDRSRQAGNAAFKDKNYRGATGGMARASAAGPPMTFRRMSMMRALTALRRHSPPTPAHTAPGPSRRGHQDVQPGNCGRRAGPHALREPLCGLPGAGAVRAGAVGRRKVCQARTRLGQGLLPPGLCVHGAQPVDGGDGGAGKGRRAGAQQRRDGACGSVGGQPGGTGASMLPFHKLAAARPPSAVPPSRATNHSTRTRQEHHRTTPNPHK